MLIDVEFELFASAQLYVNSHINTIMKTTQNFHLNVFYFLIVKCVMYITCNIICLLLEINVN